MRCCAAPARCSSMLSKTPLRAHTAIRYWQPQLHFPAGPHSARQQHSPRICRRAAGGNGFSPNDAMQNLQDIMAQMRADPYLSKILDKPKVQRALQAMREDPGAISRYTDDAEIMAVLRRLLNYGVDVQSQQEFKEFGLTPGDTVQQMYSNPELAALLQQPRVLEALAEMRANPLRAMMKYENDAEVVRALELLEATLGPGSVDVEVEELRP